MNHVIKLGLLSSVLSATLFADIKVESNATVISQMQTDIALKLTDTETNKPIVSNVKFAQLGVDKGSQIGTMEVLSDGQYAFSITRTAGCNKSANPEIKGVFSATINGKKIEEAYTICKKSKRDDSHFETAHPYKNNAKEQKILVAKDNTGDAKSFEYVLTIKGETETSYDFVTITDLSGKTLKKLKLSGQIDKTVIFTPTELPEGKLKVLFTSDSSVSKAGVSVDLVKAPESASIGVSSIGNSGEYEGIDIIHEVNLTATPSSPITFQVDIQELDKELKRTGAIYDGIKVGIKDYSPEKISFSDGVTYDINNKTITVPAGITTFHAVIPTLYDETPLSNENEIESERYKIQIGNVSATGTVINRDS